LGTRFIDRRRSPLIVEDRPVPTPKEKRRVKRGPSDPLHSSAASNRYAKLSRHHQHLHGSKGSPTEPWSWYEENAAEPRLFR
jgi:hypothetical protein